MKIATPAELENCAPQERLGSFRPQPNLRRRSIHPRGSEPSRTKQEFLQDSNINNILAKYQKTGALSHFARFSPTYGDFSSIDFQTAQNLIIQAQTTYDALPSSIRNLYPTPEAFYDFVQDPANSARMAELGLTNTPPAATRPPLPGGVSDAGADSPPNPVPTDKN